MGVELELPCPIAAAVDEAAVRNYEQWESWRISASTLGEDCERRTWYRFRWAFENEKPAPHVIRIFRTGNDREETIIGDLRNAGMTVEDRDPATGKQFKFYALGGHLTVKPDGFVTGVPGAPKKRHALEAKTHNAKSFAELVKHGVEVSKPQHETQMQVEMELGGTDRALYVALNKDNERYYFARLKHDLEKSTRLLERGRRIIQTDKPADRVRDDGSKYPCRFCAAKSICHDGVPARRNCRTCLHSTPEMDGDARWTCAKHKRDLSIDDQRAGCPSHRYLPALVNGEIAAADGDAETITYTMADGSTWVDGETAQ